MQRATWIIAVLAISCASSCSEKDLAVEKPEMSAHSGSGEIERLRTLGYIEVTEETVDPDITGIVRVDEERCWPGYNLYRSGSKGTLRRSVDLIDIRGQVVNSWNDPGGYPGGNCELMPDGNLLMIGRESVRPAATNDENSYLVRLSWDSQVIWRLGILAHHDVEVTPQGRILVLTSRDRRIPQVSTEVDTRDDYMVLVSLEGEILEERSVYEALVSNPSELTIQSDRLMTGGPGRGIDLIHSNSVEWMHQKRLFDKHRIYAPTNVLLCSRTQDTVAIIDWEKNELLWAWGKGIVSGPHDAHALENGNILLLDNGVEREWSRVIELDPLTKTIVWEYRAPNPGDFYTRGRGACQRLPNGNTLITNSTAGQAFEVTAGGEIVWEYFNPNVTADRKRFTIARMLRFETEFVDEILKAGPGP
jgi:hypothetical protein